MRRHPSSRPGFTLTELLVVIIILLLLTAVTAPIAVSLNDGRQLRNSATLVQGTLGGARDQAMAAGEPRGVRFLPTTGDRSLCDSMIYIRPGDAINEGSAIVVHDGWPKVNNSNRPYDTVVLLDVDPTRFANLLPLTRFDPDGPGGAPEEIVQTGAIRLGGGAFRQFVRYPDPANPAALNGAESSISGELNGAPVAVLRLFEPVTQPIPFGSSANFGTYGGPKSYWGPRSSATGGLWKAADQTGIEYRTGVGVDYVIPVGYIPLEAAEPITIPSGIVVDLGFLPEDVTDPIDVPEQRLSRFRPTPAGHWDVVFSPNGQVIGSAASESPIVLWMREQTAGVDLVDVGTRTVAGLAKLIKKASPGNHRLVGVFPRSGSVRVVRPNFQGDDPGQDLADTSDDNPAYYDYRRAIDPLLQGIEETR